MNTTQALVEPKVAPAAPAQSKVVKRSTSSPLMLIQGAPNVPKHIVSEVFSHNISKALTIVPTTEAPLANSTTNTSSIDSVNATKGNATAVNATEALSNEEIKEIYINRFHACSTDVCKTAAWA